MKKWNVFIHPSHFTASHLTSKFTRWQSLREAFNRVADFLKAKRNKRKHKGKSEKVEWGKKSHRKRCQRVKLEMFVNVATGEGQGSG